MHPSHPTLDYHFLSDSPHNNIHCLESKQKALLENRQKDPYNQTLLKHKQVISVISTNAISVV